MDAVIVDDEMLEAWFLRHCGALNGLSEQALAEVAPWFPIIGVAANDGLIGTLDNI